MGDLTLPGTIPKLLRRGSLVSHKEDGTGVVIDASGDPGKPLSARNSVAVAFYGSGDLNHYAEPVCRYEDLALDLTDATSLLHAIWWMAEQGDECCPAAIAALGLESLRFDGVLERALLGYPLDTSEIQAIRRVVLYLAETPDAG